jgi:c-di-GMP-binding flagellar brake protein YcgR
MSYSTKPTRSAWTPVRTWRSPRQSGERRDLERVPLEIFLDEYVDDRPHRALTTNLSATGLYMHRVATRGSKQFGRQTRHVQLEFALPGTRETIWARGEIRYDELGMDLVHGTGVHFADMARGHQQLISDYLYEQRRQKLERILELIRENRYH